MMVGRFLSEVQVFLGSVGYCLECLNDLRLVSGVIHCLVYLYRAVVRLWCAKLHWSSRMTGLLLRKAWMLEGQGCPLWSLVVLGRYEFQ